MKYLMVNDFFDIARRDNPDCDDMTKPEVQLPLVVEVLTAEDYHMFCDKSLDKNTLVKFKIQGDERIFSTQYGWLFIEITEGNLINYDEYVVIKKELEALEKKKSSAWSKVITIASKDN